MPQRSVLLTRAGEGIAHGHAGGARSVTALSAAQNPGGVAVQFADMPVGSGPPFHRHASFDEVFIVLEGVVEFQAADELHTAHAGDLVWIPGEIPHAPRCVDAGPAGVGRVLMLVTPARFEDFFHEMGAVLHAGGDHDAIARLGASFGIEFVDRPPVRVRHDPPPR